MGSLFLNFFALFLVFLVFNTSLPVNGDISLDLAPDSVAQPLEESTLFDRIEDFKQREKKRKEESRPKEKTKENILAAEANKDRNYSVFSQVSLVIPYLFVSGPRSSYTSEPTSHFSMYFRGSGANPVEVSQLWWGFRIAPFSGTGIYKSIPGRYGFTYFGPALAYGKVEKSEKKILDTASSVDERKKILQNPKRIYSMFSLGISAQTRNGVIDPTSGNPDNDINTVQGITFDSSGLWFEYFTGKIYYGTLSINYSTGIQLGEGKIFAWVGIGAGAWD